MCGRAVRNAFVGSAVAVQDFDPRATGSIPAAAGFYREQFLILLILLILFLILSAVHGAGPGALTLPLLAA